MSKRGLIRVPWPVWVLVIGMYLVGLGYYKWSQIRPYIPGQWVYDLFGPPVFGLLTWSFGICLAVTLIRYRHWLALSVLVLITYLTVVIPGGSFEARIRAELPLMKADKTYGNPLKSTKNGRTLIFWPFVTYSIDNSTGVAYDSEDRLSVDYHGIFEVIWEVRRLEPGWFFVRTT